MSLEYKGYAAGPIEFDEEARLFSGVVAGLRDGIHFSGRTADELVQAFKGSIDDYLAFCEERGVPPEKPYSGNFMVRVESSLHRKAAIRAAAEGMSLNTWIAKQIEGA
ncbi:MAG TPA: type II toxin-antitoxin system HicB family antitoxin [Geminicoccaceae bacterium]|nr:type II toxin-antitoxin system HicB family antitoxin [Geminicoccaceae bacterium]